MNWRLSALFAAGLAATASAQEVPGVEGPTNGPALGDGPHAIATTTAAEGRLVPAAKTLTLPTLDAQPLLAEDALIAATPSVKADPRLAVSRWFHEIQAPRRLVPGGRGVATTSDRSLTWSAEISSGGAVGVRLHVSRFQLPEGATLVVYNAADPSEAYGPFTGGGPRDTGAFFLPTVFGDTARVEIRVPARAVGKPVLFSIDRAVHRYRERALGMEDPRVGVPTKAGTCENDVACDASYVQDVARAVATMEISASDGNVYLCSGALLNDSDTTTQVPYFLTAHHCLSTQIDATNTEFYFDFRAATCGGVAPKLSSVPRVSGATLLATSSTSDFTFMRLAGTLPTNRFFCGWSAGLQTVGEAIVGVHHPEGLKMSISYGSLLSPDGNFHRVQWTDGVTAPGSSGSPLFNPQKQVIGQLYGGSSSCSFQSGVDEYGRFDKTYASVKQWLGSGGTGSTDDGYDPGDDAIAGARPLDVTFYDQSEAHSLSRTDLADWYSLDLSAGGRYRIFSTSPGGDDVQATLYSDVLGTNVAASDDNSGGSDQFSIDFSPTVTQTYYLKVSTVQAAASAEYSIYWLEVRPTDVKPPAPVRSLRKSVSGMLVNLRWADAARNESGYYVELSVDGGANWTRVGELPQGANSFSHDPGPGKRLYRVGAWNAGPTIRWKQIAATVVDPNELDASDPTDDAGSGATQLPSAVGGLTPTHTLSRSDSGDWYKVDLVGGKTYVFQTTGTGDPYGQLFADSAGLDLLASNDNAGAGRNFRIAYTAPRTATYWLEVSQAVPDAVFSYVLAWRQK